MPLPLHISLSRPLGLAIEQRQPLLDALTSRLKALGAAFAVRFTGVDVAANENSTRWFLVLRV